MQGHVIGVPPLREFRRIWGPKPRLEFKISGFSLAIGSGNAIGARSSGGDVQIQGSFVARFALAFPLGSLSTLKLKICDNNGNGAACLAFARTRRHDSIAIAKGKGKGILDESSIRQPGTSLQHHASRVLRNRWCRRVLRPCFRVFSCVAAPLFKLPANI
jgi:hypothetical protein